MARQVVKLRTSPKCAICKAGEDVRDRVDLVLARQGEPDPQTGQPLTWTYILEAVLPHLLGQPISKTAVRRHLGLAGGVSPHTQLVDDEAEAEKIEEEIAAPAETNALLDDIDELLASGGPISPTGVLGLQLRAWLLQTRKRVATGQEVSLTADQAARAAAQLIAAEKRGQEAALLGALAGGISATFERAVAASAGRALPVRGIEIVDAEVVAEEEPERRETDA
jgi:hypothetical protein